MQVLRFPLAKITVAFVSGVIASQYFTTSTYALFTCAFILLLSIVCMYLFAKPEFYRKMYFGICITSLSIAMGFMTMSLEKSANNPNHYVHVLKLLGPKSKIAVTLKEELKSTDKNYRYIANVKQFDNRRTEGQLLVNVKRDSSDFRYVIGTQLHIEARVLKNSKPLNPDQFDYGKYLDNKSIHGQVYISPTELVVLQIPEKSIYYFTDKLRKRIIYNLDKSNFNKRELAVLSALILGQRQEIAPDILQDYQYAGAVHILSVSGLHVGLIILFINGVLSFMPATRRASNCKLIITLVCLWSFAILASLSPSVVRAVTMFSFVAVGMHLNRRTNIFHTLLVSVLIILLFAPSFIFDVGFQLSYIALFSILWLQPMLKKLCTPRNRIVSYFWDILTVSFAAQIGAFPISVYYFHQFPGLFFVTNVLVIPLLSIIMALGVFSMVIAAFSTVPKLIVFTLEYCIRIMNGCIEFIASFESFVLKNIPMNFWMLISTYVVIITFFAWYDKPNHSKLLSTLTAVILCFSTYYATILHNERKSQWMVFNQRGNNVIVERRGLELHIKNKSAVTKWENASIQSYATANYLSITEFTPILNYNYFKGNKITIIDSNSVWLPETQSDVLVLMKSPKINLERVIASTKPRIIVADATNYPYLKNYWSATCAKENIPFHNTSEKGYFIIE